MVVFSTYRVTALPMYSTGVLTLKVTGSVTSTPSSTRVLAVVESYHTTSSRVVRPSRRAASESVCCSCAHSLPATTPSTRMTPYTELRMVR